MASSSQHHGKGNEPPFSASGNGSSDDDPSCRVKNVVPTGTVFATALERLNRISIVHLLEEVVRELDHHCQTFGQKTTEEVSRLRVEVLALIAALEKGTAANHNETVTIHQHIKELQAQIHQYSSSLESHVTNIFNRQLELHLPNIVNNVNNTFVSKLPKQTQQFLQEGDVFVTENHLKALRVQLAEMQEKLDKLKEARTELGGNEQKQVEALILKLFNATNLASILSAVNITVNGRVFALERLIEVLATVDKVLDTHIDYSDSDITGARLVLTDRTQITFVCNRREQAEGRQVHYVFSTPDWKGVPASFSMIFERRKKEMQMCGRSHVLMTYDGVYHSNIKFDLCEKAGAKPVAEATPPPPPPQAPAPRSKGR